MSQQDTGGRCVCGRRYDMACRAKSTHCMWQCGGARGAVFKTWGYPHSGGTPVRWHGMCPVAYGHMWPVQSVDCRCVTKKLDSPGLDHSSYGLPNTSLNTSSNRDSTDSLHGLFQFEKCKFQLKRTPLIEGYCNKKMLGFWL